MTAVEPTPEAVEAVAAQVRHELKTRTFPPDPVTGLGGLGLTEHDIARAVLAFLGEHPEYVPGRDQQPGDSIADMARRFSMWLNSTYPPDLCEEAVFWRRVGKISEEAGEVREASGAYWHENPRKPKGDVEDVIKELADCVGAALGAIEHLTGHQGRSMDVATARVRYVCERVGVLTAQEVPDGD